MAIKIITCPWCGKEARITYEENRVYQMKCYACHNSMLHEDRSFDRAVEFFEHQANLLQAEKDGASRKKKREAEAFVPETADGTCCGEAGVP